MTVSQNEAPKSSWTISNAGRLAFRREIMGAIAVLECAARELDTEGGRIRPISYEVGPEETARALEGCAEELRDIADRIRGATKNNSFIALGGVPRDGYTEPRLDASRLAERTVAAEALHSHIRSCEACSAFLYNDCRVGAGLDCTCISGDVCKVGAGLESACIDALGFDPWAPEYQPFRPGSATAETLPPGRIYRCKYDLSESTEPGPCYLCWLRWKRQYEQSKDDARARERCASEEGE